MMNTLEPHGRGTAADLLNMELARARQRVNRAELALERAEEMLDADSGVGINIALCSRIRAEQQRVGEARSRLTKIDTLTDARQRIEQTELALKLTEKMLAENNMLRSKMRRLVEAADRLVKIDSAGRDTGREN